MFNFALRSSPIFKAIRYEKVFRFFLLLKKIFAFLFAITLVLFSLGFFFPSGDIFFVSNFLPEILGYLAIFLVLFTFFLVNSIFLGERLRNPKQDIGISEALGEPERFNPADFLGFEAALAAHQSIKFANSKNVQVTPSIFCLFLLRNNKELEFVFSRGLLDLNAFLKDLKQDIKDASKIGESEEKYSKDFKDFIIKAITLASERGNIRVELADAFSCLPSFIPLFKRLLVKANLSEGDIANICLWLQSIKQRAQKRKRFWEKENLASHGSIARDFATGFTITLDQYSISWTERIKRGQSARIIGHKQELEAMERILSRAFTNNVLLIGAPGVGRKSCVYALAERALFGRSLSDINYKRVVELDLPRMLSLLKSQEEVEETLDLIFGEVASAGNTILVINNFHNFVGGVERPGVIDISGILSSYLELPQFKVVAITSYEGLHKYIEQKPGLLDFFGKVEVSEISKNEAIIVLQDLIFSFEKKYKKFISYPAIRDIVFLSAKYFPNAPFPKKAIDVLDEVMVDSLKQKKRSAILPSHVADIISQKSEIPVGRLEEKERDVLLNLEALIHKRIINQEEAVLEVSSALRRARSEITVRKGPMGGFLFLGPTGVGKTETAKALSEVYFGSEERMIRLDMSEFQSISDIQRLIGAHGKEGLLTTRIKEDPFSLVLLDEIEKAHPDILNLFLQILDEGYITDGLGRKASFLNSVIIATSNAGYKVILEGLKEMKKWGEVKQTLLDYLFKEAIFRPELINRFDAVVLFKPLSRENLLDIAHLMLQSLCKNLAEKGIELEITLPLKERIVELGYSPVFGAREMRRVIQEKVENVLAEAILSGKIKRGDKIKMGKDFKIIKK